VDGKMKLLNLPNKLSLFRIFLVPLLVVVIITKYSSLLATVIFGLAMLTDWLDGFIARTTNQVTTLGKLLDPIADKLLICAAFISLVETGKVPAWMVVIIVGRELAVTGLRAVAASQNEVISASYLGKYKTIIQAVTVILVILNISPWDIICLWLTLILTLASGTDYFIRFKQNIGL
jgi:CDP-diacylglycerol--glycerol-3-phosphate 3-phosphatidyltransferase